MARAAIIRAEERNESPDGGEADAEETKRVRHQATTTPGSAGNDALRSGQARGADAADRQRPRRGAEQAVVGYGPDALRGVGGVAGGVPRPCVVRAAGTAAEATGTTEGHREGRGCVMRDDELQY